MNDPEIELLKRYGSAPPAPVDDVADRVVETIHALPTHSLKRNNRTMAACAAVCATTAALLAVAAFIQPSTSSESTNVYDLVIDSQDIDVQSVLQ